MSYEERLSETIDFTSPMGRQFSALWRGNDRTKGKKLGLFSPPKRKGTIVQDLDVDATKYPIPILFDGENHDLISALFFETCNESGAWKVKHPVNGELELQLVSVTEKVQPITNASFTELETEWIVPLAVDEITSSAELADKIEEQIKAINESTAGQLDSVSKQTTASQIQALKDAAQQAADTIKNGLESISNLSADIANITNAIQRATTSNLLNPTVAIGSLATQIQKAAQDPSLATDNISERISSYSNVIVAISGAEPEVPTQEAKNTLAVKELALTSLLSTLPRIATTGTLSTRQEAVNLAETIADTFLAITDNLDQSQELFSDNLLSNQYFSQSQSYSDTEQLIALAIEYLIKTSFDLKVEKRFTLKTDKTPIDITISEYGTIGENDSNLDFFISTNKLKNTDILLLRAGTEVVVYV